MALTGETMSAKFELSNISEKQSFQRQKQELE
jgi:hypothetical protein